jgi:hypothetical protein
MAKDQSIDEKYADLVFEHTQIREKYAELLAKHQALEQEANGQKPAGGATVELSGKKYAFKANSTKAMIDGAFRNVDFADLAKKANDGDTGAKGILAALIEDGCKLVYEVN